MGEQLAKKNNRPPKKRDVKKAILVRLDEKVPPTNKKIRRNASIIG